MNKNRRIFISICAFILLAWCLFWIKFCKYIVLLFGITLPVWIVALVVSPAFIGSKRWKWFPIVSWASLLSLALILFVTWTISYFDTTTTTYYLNVEIEKDNISRTYKSMIQSSIVHVPLLLRDFKTRGNSFKGEAVFCDLGNGDNVIATLSFPKNSGGYPFIRLPWLAAELERGEGENCPTFIEGQIELTGEYVPTFVSFFDIEDPGSIERVEYFGAVKKKDYVIKRIWVEMTHDEYKDYGIRNHMPWIDWMDTIAGRKTYYDAFHRAGVMYKSELFARP